jgi:antitoxin ParD1/3/4
MNVSLTPELEKLIDAKVASGMYHTASEVVRDALRLLVERDELRERRLQALKGDIQAGLNQLESGETVSGGEAFDIARRRSGERRAQGQSAAPPSHNPRSDA